MSEQKHNVPRGTEPLRADDPTSIGAYRLLRRLGAGGMGQVYLARSARGRTVAVKLVRRELAEQEEFRVRFRREVTAARRVGGEWTAPVLDADTEADVPWVATGYVAGPTLRQVVQEDYGPLPERSLRLLADGLARALGAIHEAGLVHRDLKPSNVLLTLDGPRVIDFGIARALETSATGGLTRSGVSVGSPGFMSPEQVRGGTVTAASDVFCLGSVLAYAATGRAPFGSGEAGVATVLYRITREEPDLDGVPEALRELVTSCLAKNPEDRPSVTEVLASLPADTAEGGEVPGGPPGERQDTSRSWLPEAVIAQLGRHAVQLLEAEEPERTAGTGGTPRPSPAASAADAPEPAAPDGGDARTAERTAVDGAGDIHGLPTVIRGPAPALPPPPPGHGPGYPTPVPAPPQRAGAGLTVVLLTLVALLAGAATTLLLVRGEEGSAGAAGTGDPTPTATATSRSGDRNTSPQASTSSHGHSTDTGGPIPERFLGTWHSTLPGRPDHTRRMVVRQARPGEVAMTLTADGPNYHCEFQAVLLSADDTVRLDASVVTVGADSGSCRPGQPTTLVLVGGDRLRRDNADGTPPLTYTRAS